MRQFFSQRNMFAFITYYQQFVLKLFLTENIFKTDYYIFWLFSLLDNYMYHQKKVSLVKY